MAIEGVFKGKRMAGNILLHVIPVIQVLDSWAPGASIGKRGHPPSGNVVKCFVH